MGERQPSIPRNTFLVTALHADNIFKNKNKNKIQSRQTIALYRAQSEHVCYWLTVTNRPKLLSNKQFTLRVKHSCSGLNADQMILSEMSVNYRHDREWRKVVEAEYPVHSRLDWVFCLWLKAGVYQTPGWTARTLCNGCRCATAASAALQQRNCFTCNDMSNIASSKQFPVANTGQWCLQITVLSILPLYRSRCFCFCLALTFSACLDFSSFYVQVY